MMSSPFKTGVEEYARQCTLQRRRYEDCRHQTRQGESSGSATQTWTIAQTIAAREVVQREVAQAAHLNHCTEQTMQSCMIDLLELPVDPLAWESSDSVLDETRTAEFEANSLQDERGSNTVQTITYPTGKGACSTSYGAP